MKKVILLMMVAVAITFSSCTKEGKEGAPGKDGNANVVSSTLTVYASDWIYEAPSWRVNMTYPAITQSIMDGGAVLVYIKNSSNTYSQLPLTIYTNASYSSTLEVATVLGGLTVFWTDSDLVQPDNPGGATLKVVVLAAGMALEPGVDVSNYQSIKEAYQLED